MRRRLLMGLPPQKPPCPLATVLSLQQPSPICHPERTRISCFTALTGATYVVLPKENHMKLIEAATLDRKSGGAEGSAVPRTLHGNVFLESYPQKSVGSARAWSF